MQRSALLALLFVLQAALPAQAGTTFDAVKARGVLRCGVHPGLNGLSAPDEKGRWSGLDVDVCRAVAAAMFGDDAKVKYVALDSANRFTSLQSGEIDLLVRNTTATLTRDTTNGFNFGPVNYYDGQGFLVPRKSNVKRAADLKGAIICTSAGTTSEQNLADYSRIHQLNFKVITFEKLDGVIAAYNAGRCDAMSSDRTELGSIRIAQTANPDDNEILPETISKEPFAPLVRHGDDQWFDLVKWSLYAMIEAEECGVTAANVDEMAKSTDPNLQRLLGTAGELGRTLGVDDKFAYRIIKSVGNYGESFDRNLGAGSKLKLERGLNKLWKDGGLHYALPFR